MIKAFSSLKFFDGQLATVCYRKCFTWSRLGGEILNHAKTIEYYSNGDAGLTRAIVVS